MPVAAAVTIDAPTTLAARGIPNTRRLRELHGATVPAAARDSAEQALRSLYPGTGTLHVDDTGRLTLDRTPIGHLTAIPTQRHTQCPAGDDLMALVHAVTSPPQEGRP